ncbi:MAG: glycosyltransferase [Candidatus Eisenbacteria bacterium]
MKELLYISYFFPPLGGAGVQRAAKFARYLPEFNWRASVITSDARYWMDDPSLLADVDDACEVVRVPHWGSGAMQRQAGGGVRSSGRVRWLRALSRWLFVPDNYVAWSAAAARSAARMLASGRFAACLTTSSPDSAHLIGLWLRARFGIPWIADFRDPWTRRLSYAPPSQWHDRLHHRLEREVLHGADGVIVTSEATRDDFLERYRSLEPARVQVVTNGYDEADFLAALRATADREDLLRGEILHSGQLNPERPIEPYLRGLTRYLERARVPSLPASLFAGGHYDRDVAAVAKHRLEAYVRFVPNRPHLVAVGDCLHARILLLMEDPSPRGALILPGKIFEYLRAGRPILALVAPSGAAAHLVRSLDAGLVADPTRPEEIASALEALLRRTEAAGSKCLAIRPGASVARFERRSITRQLASILDSAEMKSSNRSLPAPV